MTSTNTHGAGLGRLFNYAAALAVLLFSAGAVDAQTQIFVSPQGVDSNSGASATSRGNDGPVRTLDQALDIANNSSDANIISFAAGDYDLNGNDIGDDSNEFNLAFEARGAVTIDLEGDTFDIDPRGSRGFNQSSTFSFLSAGGTFRLEDGDIDFESGQIALGTGVVEFDIDDIRVFQAAVSGTPDYDELPDSIRFLDTNRSASGANTRVNTSGGLIPAVVDSEGDFIAIEVNFASSTSAATGGTLTNVSTRIGDDGGVVGLFVDQFDAISGSVTIADGNGRGNAAVEFEGGGNFGDVTLLNGADLVIDADTTGGISFNDFAQSGGTLTVDDGDFITVFGDFDLDGGDFANNAILALAGEGDIDFDVESGFEIEGLQFVGGNNVTFDGGQTISIVGNRGGINAGIGGTPADFFVGGGTTLDLNGGAIVLAGGDDFGDRGGSSVVNGVIEDGLVRFADAEANNDEDDDNDVATLAGLLGGTGVYDDIRIDRDVNLSPIANAEFTGTLFLIDGSIVTNQAVIRTTGGTFLGIVTGDLSPAEGDFGGDLPQVIVDITNDNQTPRFVEARLADSSGLFTGETGGFNGEENFFDLTYVDDQPGDRDTATVGNEFAAGNIRNLTIDVANGVVTAGAAAFNQAVGEPVVIGGTQTRPGNGFIQGDLIVRDGNRGRDFTGDNDAADFVLDGVQLGVFGDIIVEDDATISLDGSFLYATSDGNRVEGTIEGSGTLSLLDDAVITGAGNVSGSDSRITSGIRVGSPVTLNGASTESGNNVALRNFRSIDGDIFDRNAADFDDNTLTVSLVGDNEGGSGDPERAGNITGDIALDGTTLVLESPLHLTGPFDLEIGQLNVGDNTFFLEGPSGLELGADVIGLGSVWPATGGSQDLNNDGVIDINDGDFDGDGDVDEDDRNFADDFQRRLLASRIDSNNDGVIDDRDSFGGDLNNDGDIDSEDQDILDLVASVASPDDIVTQADLDAIRAASPNGGGIDLTGDINGDGVVNAVDQALLDIANVDGIDGVGDNDQDAVAAGDPDRDGVVEVDIDGDGDVDSDDQLIFDTFDRDNNDVISDEDQIVFAIADSGNPTGVGNDGVISPLGDVDGDGFVDNRDRTIFAAADVDDNGEIGANDRLAFARADSQPDGVIDALGEFDVNDDGVFDQRDRDIIARGQLGGSEDITITGDNVDSITIPTFHPGDEPTDLTIIGEDIIVTNLLRITGILDAESADNEPSDPGADVDYSVTLADGATLVLDDGFSIFRTGSESGSDNDDELVFEGGFDLIDNEQGPVDPTTVLALASGNVGTFTVNGTASLPEVGVNRQAQVTFDIEDLVVSNGAQLNLNGHIFNLSGDLTLNGDDDVVNSQTTQAGDSTVSRRSTVNPFSEIAFVGSDSSMVNVPTGTLLGDGVDIRINKEDGAVVSLMSGSLLFDDEFDGTPTTSTDTNNDETLFLESGVFVVGTPDNQQTVYVRLDHENTPLLSEDVDGGQGFVIVGAEGQDQSIALTDSYIAGNVRKRVANTGTATPGRVIYPTGEMDDSDDDDRDYAPFVFDFESNGAGATFGLRSINVTFVDESPGQNTSLPLDGPAPAIEGTPEFYWLVSTTGSALGQGTTFNIEARADDFMIVNNIDNLELIRRQDGSVAGNPYTNVGGDATAFTIDPDGSQDGDLGDDIVVVQESGISSFLGPQGTIVTFGLTANQRPVSNEGPGSSVIPTEFAVNGTFPNPFSARAELSFDLPEAATVTLEVFDVMGRQVMNVNTGGLNAGGDQRIAIDGSSLASGVYVYRLRAAGATDTWTRSGQITLAR